MKCVNERKGGGGKLSHSNRVPTRFYVFLYINHLISANLIIQENKNNLGQDIELSSQNKTSKTDLDGSEQAVG